MPEPNFENRTLYHGDNLDFLRGMNSGTVNLIATDPPFNKDKDFHATPDSLAAGARFQDRWSWQRDIHDDWLIAIQRDEPEVWHVITAAKEVYGDDMAAFLCWLGVRLLEMHRVLTDDGSLYLHIDHTAHAWVKCLMDAIFGKSNFRNEVVWRRTTSHTDAKGLGSVHDSILFYRKSTELTWNPVYQPLDPEYVENYYRYKDSDGRRFMSSDLSGAGSGPDRNFGERGVIAPPKGRHWMYDDAGIERLLADNKIFWTRNGVPRFKVYLDEHLGMPATDVWDDIQPLRSWHKERAGYPTQKPLALYERIIKASSNEGDFVLDPFCGCATTPIAAERLGRQWLGMDIWNGAHQIVLDRLESEGLAVKVDGVRQSNGQRLLTFGDIHYETTPPTRTDDGEPATPTFRTPTGRAVRYPRPRTQHATLLADLGPFCQGCGRNYGGDTRVLEVDHVSPKSDGGTDAYENLTLLCPPCNKEKRDRITLSGLQDENRKNGYLLPENEGNIRRGRAVQTARRRRR